MALTTDLNCTITNPKVGVRRYLFAGKKVAEQLTNLKTIMHIRCTGCSARYRVDDEYGGRWGRCSQCNARFMLPIPDPDRLLKWASSAPWSKLLQFVNNRGAAGHSRDTVREFVDILERRRWAEEYRVRREMSQSRPPLSRRERIWAESDSRLRRRRSLDELRNLGPYEFERFVADLFNAQDYVAKAVGGTADRGIDVVVCTRDGTKWGVAQCKRYAANTRVTASDIRDFGGAFMLSGAEKGFFFTTGVFTRNARRTARGFPWLTTYNGSQLVDYIEQIHRQIEGS